MQDSDKRIIIDLRSIREVIQIILNYKPVVRYLLTAIIILLIFYWLSPNDLKRPLIKFVGVLLSLGLIFLTYGDWKEKRIEKSREKELKRELEHEKQKNLDVEKQRNALSEYVQWSESLKQFFTFFIKNRVVFLEEKENSIHYRNSIIKPSQTSGTKGTMWGMSRRGTEVEENMQKLISEGFVKKISPGVRSTYDYALELTQKGLQVRDVVIALKLDNF